MIFASLFLVSLGTISHNAFADSVTATIPVGNSPFDISVNPNTNKIYAADIYHDTVSVIDGSTNNVVTTFGSSALSAIAVNPITDRIYVTDVNSVGTVSVIDGATNQVMSTIPVGYGPVGVAINSNTNTIYVSNHGSASVSVIDGTTNNVTNTISIGNHLPSFIAVNPKTNMVYVVSNQSPATSGYSFSNDNTVSIINGTTNSVVGTVTVGVSPYGVAVNPNTNEIYVADNGGDNRIFVIDGATNSVSGSIQVGSNPVDIAINSSNNMIYVTNFGSNTVSVIDGSNNSALTTVSVGSQPYGVGVNLDTNRIYVANSNSNSVSVIDGNSANTSTTPSSPQNLQSVSGNSQATLSWTAPSSNGGSTITGYNIYRGTTSGSEGSTPVGTVSGSALTYTDTGLTNGQTYFYKVTAVNSVGESSQSNEASATPVAPVTSPQPPTGLTATSTSASQINLSWTAPTNNGGSIITGYGIERSTDNGSTWSTVQSNSGSTATTYSDTGLAASTNYTYRVSAINSVGTSQPSNTASATTSAVTPPPPPAGITLNNVQSTSGTVSSSNQMTLTNFNAGTGNNRLLVVGISANNNNAISVTFGGVQLTKKVSSFSNNDAEFWYLKNPSSTGNIVVTMAGSTSVVVGAYSFSGVNQTTPLSTSTTNHNSAAGSPMVSLTTVNPNDWVLDLPSIYGGVTLGSPTCTQQWNTHVPSAVTGVSSSAIQTTTGSVTCKWTASSGEMWDDVAVEVKAYSSGSAGSTPTVPSPPTGLATTVVSSSQINLSWTAPSNNGGSAITGYDVQRSVNNGNTWSTVTPNTGSTATTYNDTGLTSSTTYTYRVSAINSIGIGSPSNTSSATTSTVTTSGGITLVNVQSTSGSTSTSNPIMLTDFNVGTGNNRLLVVGVSADNSNVGSITFGGVSLTKKVSSFHNNDAEFWYLKNPTGTGAIVVTMTGSTSAVVGAYSFSGVNQTNPLPTNISSYNSVASNPAISITAKFANDFIVDLPSIYGGVTLGSPTCTQQWNTHVPSAITGASSSTMVQSPGSVTCKWAASSVDLWDDAAIEIAASN